MDLWKKFDERNVTYTTYPSELLGMLTDTSIPVFVDSEFISDILRLISVSDFGAFIPTLPRYVTPEKIVHSW